MSDPTVQDLVDPLSFDAPPLGKRFTQDALERWFNTKFGYQISGINPRRDDTGNRFILLFSQERGPYADDIGGTEFEYIGEGLPEKGDQDPSSPGNSVLIDAITDPVPIFFLYKGEHDSAWEYRGLVDVQEWGWQTNTTAQRQEIVFTMRLLTEPTGTYTTDPSTGGTTVPEDLGSQLYLVPVSDEWRPQFNRTVVTPLSLELVADVPDPLREANADRVWGTTATDSQRKRQHATAMEAGDHVLFYHDGRFIGQAVVDQTFVSEAVGEFIWDNPASKYIFTIDAFSRDTPPIHQLWTELGYEGQPVVPGFQRVAADRLSNLSADTIAALL